MEPLIEPVLIERAGDLGWLASPPDSYPLRFAVVATTAEGAREKFAEALERWLADLPEYPCGP